MERVARRHLSNKGLMLALAVAAWGSETMPLVQDLLGEGGNVDAALKAQWRVVLANWKRGISFPKDMDESHRRLVRDGEPKYYQHCVACHGSDGKGLGVAGADVRLAPSLVDSPRVHGDPGKLVPILLHGLVGPLDGVTYQAGYMAPGKALGLVREERDIAQVLSFIRYAWGKESGPISEADVKTIKAATKGRVAPWTQQDLEGP